MNWPSIDVLLMLPALLIGLTFHEFAHAWSSSLLGDDFARRQGRVSLNPLRHLTLPGTLAILLLPFGWGKPVPVNLYNFRSPKRDYLLSSLAGPAANLLLALVGLGLVQLMRHTYRFGEHADLAALTHLWLVFFVITNFGLAVFNLLPVPPLDGSKIWSCIVPGWKASTLERKGLFLIIIVIVFWQGPLGRRYGAAVDRLVDFMASDYMLVREISHKANEALAAGRFDEAEALLGQVVAIDPASHTSYYARGVVHMQKGDFTQALDDLSRAIELSGGDPDYYEMRARAFGGLERMEDMEKDLATARSLRGECPAASQPAAGAEERSTGIRNRGP